MSVSKVFTEAMAKLKSDARKNIMTELEQWFAANPEVKYIYWRQGRQEWNDGDPCNFYTYEVYAAGPDEEAVPTLGYREDLPEVDFDWQKDYKLMEMLFGGNQILVQVTPNPIKITTHSYSDY